MKHYLVGPNRPATRPRPTGLLSPLHGPRRSCTQHQRRWSPARMQTRHIPSCQAKRPSVARVCMALTQSTKLPKSRPLTPHILPFQPDLEHPCMKPDTNKPGPLHRRSTPNLSTQQSLKQTSPATTKPSRYCRFSREAPWPFLSFVRARSPHPATLLQATPARSCPLSSTVNQPRTLPS